MQSPAHAFHEKQVEVSLQNAERGRVFSLSPETVSLQGRALRLKDEDIKEAGLAAGLWDGDRIAFKRMNKSIKYLRACAQKQSGRGREPFVEYP